MKIRSYAIVTLGLMIAVPAWAHCGFCGEGDESPGSRPEHGGGGSNAEVGKPAPDFTLESTDGTEYKLSDFKGKIVVLEWINHECPVVNRCHKNNVMADTMAKFKDKPVVWLAVDSSYFCMDKLDNVKKWIQAEKIDYPYLLDPKGKVGHLYEAKTTPHMFVIDKNGVLAYAGAIDDDPYGKKDNSSNYVAEAVDALLNGSAVATATTKSYGCSVKYKPATGG